MSNEAVGRLDGRKKDAMRISVIPFMMGHFPEHMGVQRTAQTPATMNGADGCGRLASFAGRGVQWLRDTGRGTG